MPKHNSKSNDRMSTSRSPQERKETLRNIRAQTEFLQDRISDKTISNLKSCMEKADIISSETSIEEKITDPEEVLLDSELMNMSSKVLKNCTKSLKEHVGAYNEVEFAQKLVQHVKHLSNIEAETPDWSLLASDVTKHFKITPNYSTLLGTLALLERKEINKKRPIVREAQAQLKRPEKIAEVEKEEEGSEQIVNIRKCISKYYKTNSKPLDFFKFVLNPNDFGKTIENILQISFLVRDGKVKITKDSSEILVIQSCTKEIERSAETSPNIQNVMYLNMDQWKVLKNIYRLEKPMIEFDCSK